MTTPLKCYSVSITLPVVAKDEEDAKEQGISLIFEEAATDNPTGLKVEFTGYSEFDEEGHVIPLINRRKDKEPEQVSFERAEEVIQILKEGDYQEIEIVIPEIIQILSELSRALLPWRRKKEEK